MAQPKYNPNQVDFSLKKEDETQGPKSNLKLLNDSTSQKEFKTRNKSNRFFYKVSNHQELFRIGRSFYEDYISGVKSFAISSTGYQTSQQKTILGLACFFDHKDDYKIAIVSDNLQQGAFSDIVSISKTYESSLFGEDYKIKVKSFYNHFDFINLNDLLDLSANQELGEYDSVFDYIVDSYDLVFWDVPELHKIQLDSERYFPMIMKFESISIIVSKKISKQSDIDELQQFFLGYGINMKGLLFEEKNNFEKKVEDIGTNKSDTVIVKKKWWQRIFSK